MAKNRNTFEKHRREVEKKRQAEEKRLRRENRRKTRSAPLMTDRSHDDTVPTAKD